MVDVNGCRSTTESRRYAAALTATVHARARRKGRASLIVRDVTRNLSHDSPADVVGILDDLTELVSAPAKPGPVCSVSVALARIAATDETVAAEVRKRVDDDAYPAAGVATVLTNRTGAVVAAYTLRRHRKRGTVTGCRCPR
jgi:hypothetical protein